MQQTKLVAFCGGMGAGKDTYGEVFEQNTPNAIHYSFATPLKEEVQQMMDKVRYGIKLSVEDYQNVTEKELEKAQEIIQYIPLGLKTTDRHPKIRELLQYWGTGVRRKHEPNYWVDRTREFIISRLALGYSVYLTDARFKNEMELVYQLGGTLVFLNASEQERKKRILNRDGFEPTYEALNHASEQDYKTNQHLGIALDTEQIPENDILTILRKHKVC